MRPVAISLIVHALVIAWFAWPHERDAVVVWQPPSLVVDRQAPPTEVVLVEETPGRGGGAAVANAAARSAPRRSPDAWQHVRISVESCAGTSRTEIGLGLGDGRGSGDGNGNGNGNGNGIGFGKGGGIRIAEPVPAPPAVELPLPSKARPAKLIYPTRDEEVDDDASLFVARVTVDAEGDVVGARMIKTRPGSRGDHAANAIWQFRYAPALDDRGTPIASTFDQPFQVR